MNDRTKLLESLRTRNSRTGIVTADRYFQECEGCFSGGFCPVRDIGAQSEDAWRKAIKDAETKLTYSSPRCRIIKESISSRRVDGAILKFDAIVTTSARDLDGDVIETKGVEFNLSSPLLWQHIHMSPIGVTVEMLEQTSKKLRARFAIADTALGRDAATLVKLGALRISHGFDPIEYEPMEDEKGWHFPRVKVYEVSLVSLPANEQAIITAIAGKSYRSALVQGWSKSLAKAHGHVCTCKQQQVLQLDSGMIRSITEIREDTAALIADAIKGLAVTSDTFTIKAGDSPPPDDEDSAEIEVPKGDDFGDGVDVPDSSDSDIPVDQKSHTTEQIIAILANAKTDALEEAQRLIPLMLRHRREQAEGKRPKPAPDLLSEIFNQPA